MSARVRSRACCVHLAAGVALCLALTLPHLTADLYGDEAGHTARYLGGDALSAILADPALVHPPLFFLLASAAYALVGEAWAMRLPSLLFAAATIPAFAVAARRLLGPRFFVPAVYTAALSPFLLEFAGEGRAYAMTLFFSVASLIAFCDFLERENPPRAALLAAACVAGALTHFIFLLQAAFFALWYLGSRRRATRPAIGAALAFVLIVGPFLMVQAKSGAHGVAVMLQGGWSGGAVQHVNTLGRLGVALAYGYNLFLVGPLGPTRTVGLAALRDNLPLAFGVAAVLVGVSAVLLRGPRRSAPAGFLVAGVAVPVAIAFAGSVASLYLVREKHLAIVWVFAQLLLLAGLVGLWQRPWGRAVVACHVLLVLLALFNGTVRADTYSRRMNWAGLAAALCAAAGPDDVLVTYYPLSEGRLVSGARAVVLGPGAQSVADLAAASGRLDREVDGTIFLIDNETDRNLLDPQNVFIRSLRQRRAATERSFGRNLKLLAFVRSGPG